MVRDTGVGMPPEVLDRIFEPFFTTKEIGKGTGLGLSVVIGVVESHGGFLDVQSKMGEGTEFKLNFPALLETGPAKPAQPQGKPAHGHGELILLVDDEPPLLRVVSKILEKHGYKTLCANRGAEALKLYAENSRAIKVVISDFSMPGMDGLTLAKSLRSNHPEINIIIASGLDENLDGARLAEHNVRRVLKKQFTTETVLEALQQILHPW
jgi:CheY-like chemotaxis protein